MLVTGAGGFVGGALSRGFARLGWDVTAVDRHFDETWQASGVHLITADLGRVGPTRLPACDVVVHGAWITTDPDTLGVHPAAYAAQNLQPLLTVLEHVDRTQPDGFVFLSSSGVFSPDDGAGELHDQVHPTGRSPYGALKRAAEILIPGALPGPTAVHVVRLGYVFGPDEVARPSRSRVSLVARLLDDARRGRPLHVASDDPRRDWTFSGDLAPAIDLLLAGPHHDRPVHLCSPHVVRDREWAELIASRFPESEILATGPVGDRVKAPMAPSDLPALYEFGWTSPEAGLTRLLGTEAVSP